MSQEGLSFGCVFRFSAYACLRSVHPYDCLLDFFCVMSLVAHNSVQACGWVNGGAGASRQTLGDARKKPSTSDPARHQPLQPLPAPSVDRHWPICSLIHLSVRHFAPFPCKACKLRCEAAWFGSTDSLRQVEFARQTIKATVAERQKVTELLKDGDVTTENLNEVL